MFYKKMILIIALLTLFAWAVIFYKDTMFKQKGTEFSQQQKQNNKEVGEQKGHQHAHEHHREGNHEHSRNNELHDDHVVKLSENQIRQMGLQTRTVGPGTLFLTISTPAKIILQPNRLAHIIPKISGIARQADKNIGDFVRAGEIMAVLESHDMADIKAGYLAALSKERLAASVLNREEKLYQEKVSPAQDYMNAKNNYEEALINVQLTKQKLRSFGLNNQEISDLGNQNDPDLRLYHIPSPIDGTVIMRHITYGEFIENNKTIYEVADLKKVWVEIGIYPKDLYQVKVGQLIEVEIPGENRSSQARIIYVSPIVAEETITAKAIAELDNSQGTWHPGTFVKANIMTEKMDVPLVITKEAIQSSEGQIFVFVVTPEGFEKRMIKLGLSDQDHVQILSGLKPGDQYVANKSFLLKAELGKSTAEHEH
jgi:cobalt-zinc-cadmium efflux system membrane fusion protein